MGQIGFTEKITNTRLHVSIFFLIEKIGCMYFLSFYDQCTRLWWDTDKMALFAINLDLGL